MGYQLKAYIGKKDSLSPILEGYDESQCVELTDGFHMIPMTDDLFDAINDGNPSKGLSTFELFNEHIENKTIQLIGNLELAYVESDIFGGQGGHVGVIWKNGKRDFLGDRHKNTMNQILNKIGVKKNSKKDEFEALGLDQHRETEDWLD